MLKYKSQHLCMHSSVLEPNSLRHSYAPPTIVRQVPRNRSKPHTLIWTSPNILSVIWLFHKIGIDSKAL